MARLLDVVGRTYNVHFEEVMLPDGGRFVSGWDKGVRIFELVDGPRPGVLGGSGKRLGYVYLDLYQRSSFLGRPSSQLAGAQILCSGHAYLSMNFAPQGF